MTKLNFAVFLITDGRDNFSKKDAAEEFKIKHGKEIANKLNIVQIFIDIGGDQPRNKQIADEMVRPSSLW